MTISCSYPRLYWLARRLFAFVVLLAGAVSATGACNPPNIQSGDATGQVGVAFSYQIQATGNPDSYGATGLPPGLTVNTSTGVISGTPTTLGTYSVTLSATKGANCTGTKVVTFTISLPSLPTNAFVGFRLPDFQTPPGLGYTPRLMLQMGATDPNGSHPFNVTLEVDASDAHDWSKPVPYNRFVGIDDAASWITGAPLPVRDSSGPSGAPRDFSTAQLTQSPPAVYMKADPRATRFGIFQMDTNPTTNSRITLSLWPSASSTVPNGYGGTLGTDVEHLPNRFSGAAYYPATFAINGPADARDNATTIYADNDNVTRPADAIYPGAATTTGAGTPYYDTGSTGSRVYHPIMLNRPFRNVAELGYAFRDLPWKTLDFFTDKSADAGLLDIFTVSDGAPVLDGSGNVIGMAPPTMAAGSVNLNSTQAADLQSVFVGTIRGELDSPLQTVSSSAAQTMATNIVSATSATAMQNKSELVTRTGLPTAILPTASNDDQSVKPRREVVARAVSSIAQTRVWNLLIDVVAQSGRYAPGETDLNKFNVQGEQHYWIHVTIDRFTGQVLDKQIEVVNE